MFVLAKLLFYVSVTALFFLMAGLYKPWVMLWWRDVQNRRSVIKLYGIVAVITYAAYRIILFVV